MFLNGPMGMFEDPGSAAHPTVAQARRHPAFTFGGGGASAAALASSGSMTTSSRSTGGVRRWSSSSSRLPGLEPRGAPLLMPLISATEDEHSHFEPSNRAEAAYLVADTSTVDVSIPLHSRSARATVIDADNFCFLGRSIAWEYKARSRRVSRCSRQAQRAVLIGPRERRQLFVRPTKTFQKVFAIRARVTPSCRLGNIGRTRAGETAARFSPVRLLWKGWLPTYLVAGLAYRSGLSHGQRHLRDARSCAAIPAARRIRRGRAAEVRIQYAEASNPPLPSDPRTDRRALVGAPVSTRTIRPICSSGVSNRHDSAEFSGRGFRHRCPALPW